MQEYRNIYQIARESTGLTQERAAELMDISVDSVRAYEGGKRIPPDHIVVKMIEIYNTQYLAYQHLKTKSKVADCILPDLEIKDLSVSILGLHKEIKDFLECEEVLIEIGADGKVDDSEIIEFQNIMKELDDIVRAVMTLKYSNKRKND